ncbi:type II secretion system secretin GspD [Hyphomicrobium sp.]|uniref:type II secretion system secretin GspD n=1 Tax=Hyphomicrobium sp. TaxID=82 RepID=UPI0025BCAE64|nr:type II secretion system secretin GspD [Hyphomicrobium sp.]
MAKLSNASLAPARPVDRPQYNSIGSAQALSEKFPGDNRVTSQATRQMNAGVSQSGSGYELNFNDTELSDFVKVVLKDTLGMTYVFDSHVEGRVTLSTGGPVSRTQLISILESVLATYKAALLIENNVYRVVPEADARQQGISAFDYVKESREVGAGYGVSIFPLRYVSTDAIMRMLDGLLVKQEDLRASVYNNLLFVRGSNQARQSVIDIISMFDVDWMKGQSAGLFKLNNAAPDDVIRELAQVFQTERQGRGLVKFQPIARLNAILVLAPKSQSIDKAAEWISRLDHGGADDNNFYVYRVENGRAKDLAQLLTAAFSGSSGSLRGAEEKEVAPTSGASRMGSGGGTGSSFGSSFGSSIGGNSSAGTGSGLAGGDTPGSSGSSSGPLKSAPPIAATDDTSTDDSSASSGGSSSSSDQVRITPDERNNKLLIKASERNYRKILQILRRIDQPPLQVLINATLAEVTLNDNLAYGVQFYLQKNHGKAGAIGFSTADALAIAPVTPGLNLIAGAVGSDPRVILDALAQETAVRVVSSPSVVVLHNQPATLEVGDEVPITTRQAQSVINPDSPTVNEIEFKNTGVILNVTPRINSNGLVTMEIQQEVSAVQNPAGQSSSSSTTLTPTISQRRVTSTIAVQSGQMVVLGGLIREEVNRSKSSIPVLNKIPYIGDVLGGDTNNTKVRTELIVFIRPTVIHDPEDASNAAEALRAGMQSLAPRPTAWDVNAQDKGAGGRASVIK